MGKQPAGCFNKSCVHARFMSSSHMTPLKAVRVTSVWMCCDCVMACVQPDWSGNIVVSHSGAAAATHCGKTCWFGKKNKNGESEGEHGEEVPNGEDEIPLPLPSTASRKTGRTRSSLSAAVLLCVCPDFCCSDTKIHIFDPVFTS